MYFDRAMMKDTSYCMGVYLHSTHGGIEYTVRHFEWRFPRSNETLLARRCSGFLMSIIGDGAPLLKGELIPCRLASKEEGGGGGGGYYQIQEQQFAARLRADYPEISSGCAANVTESFMDILRIANATHLCSRGIQATLLHAVYVSIQPHEKYTAAAAGAPKRNPATRASIVELIKEAEAKEEEGRRSEHSECSICLEEILPWAGSNARAIVLTMPCCSHAFHGSCIVEWLDNGYSCPLCRYPMPRPKFRPIASHGW